jgi:hypothetical protein
VHLDALHLRGAAAGEAAAAAARACIGHSTWAMGIAAGTRQTL